MKKKTVKLTKKAEVMLKHMEIHSIKDIVLAAQYDPLSGMLIVTDAIDPVWGSEKTYQAGWKLDTKSAMNVGSQPDITKR